MSTLDDIKKRAEKATEGPWIEFHENGTPGVAEAFTCPPATGPFLIDYGADRDQQKRDADFIAHARTDVPKLVAALDAVEGMTGKLLDSSDSPPGQDDFNKGIDQGFAIAAKAIRSAIEEALR